MTDYLYISEYASPPIMNGLQIAAGAWPVITVQRIEITGSSVQSAAFNAATKFVRLNCTAVCAVAAGLNPTASTGADGVSERLAANQTEFFVPLEPALIVAVIATT